MILTNEQPYPLPDGWQWCRLGDIAKLFTGNSINERIKAEKYLGRTDGQIYIATKDIGFDNQIDYATNIRIPAGDNFKTAPANTPLLCIEGGSAGRKLGFTNQPVCFVNKLCAFVASEMNQKLIYYFLQTQDFAEQFTAMKHGLIGGVSIKNLTEIKFPLPPLDEQQRIVSLLDELFADLDEAKTLAQSVVDGSKLRRTAILHKAFTGELSQLWRDEHGTTLGDWQWGTLNSVAECLDNLRSPVNAAERAKRPGKIPYYGATGQVGWIDDFLTDEQLVLLGEDGAPFLDMFKDKAYIIEGKAWVNNHAHILRSRFGNVGNKFLCHYLNVFDFSSYVNGTTRLKLTQAKMKTIPIPLPPPEEQKEIVRLLDDLLGREQRTKDHALKTIERVELMKKSILARAFRGELGTN